MAVGGPSRRVNPSISTSKPVGSSLAFPSIHTVSESTMSMPKASRSNLSPPRIATKRRTPSIASTSSATASVRRSRWLLTLIALLCCLMVLPQSVSASEGDRSFEYRMCVSSCTADACRDHVDDGVVFAPPEHRLPWILRVTRWTCEDDCKYHCTHMVTNDANDRVKRIKVEAQQEVDTLAREQPISESAKKERIQALVEQKLAHLNPVQKQMVQYHGKWVFIRFLGAQEPLSVLFSLLNLRVHAQALFMLRKQLPDAFPLKLVYIVHSLISINAWLWSAVFHARDKNLTEKLDYFSAASVILSGFFFSVCRLFRIAPGSDRFIVFRRICMGALLLHILYLSIGRFDYAYNMSANVVVGLAHTFLWLIYSLRPTTFPSNPLIDRSAHSRAAMRAAKPSLSANSTPTIMNGASTPPVPVLTNIGPPSSSPKARRRLQLLLLLMVAASMLELLDFPPIMRLLDAHSLWHLATVPITKMWYDWLVADAQECVSTGWWLGERFYGSGNDSTTHGFGSDSPAVAWAMAFFEKFTEKLKGRAASLAQNIELNALTNKLNELANKAGFNRNNSATAGVGGSHEGLGLGLGINGVHSRSSAAAAAAAAAASAYHDSATLGASLPTTAGPAAAATSTGIGVGPAAYAGSTDRDPAGSNPPPSGKAKRW